MSPESTTFTVPAHYYQHFDVSPSAVIPAASMGGWQTSPVALSAAHTALVVMHAWHFDHLDHRPGLRRCAEYLSRADVITQTVFPRLLEQVRRSPLRVYHIAAPGAAYAQQYPGFDEAKRRRRDILNDPAPPTARPKPPIDPCFTELQSFKRQYAYPGRHNQADARAAFEHVRFPHEAEPAPHEMVCEDADDLLACCLADGVNHLIYVGFAINWCLLMSPGGMLEMSDRGLMCSTIREAVTAVENRESAPNELHKEEALWRVSLRFGYVFNIEPFLAALP